MVLKIFKIKKERKTFRPKSSPNIGLDLGSCFYTGGLYNKRSYSIIKSNYMHLV